MSQPLLVADQIIAAVEQRPGCLLEELVLACPDLTWNQIFLEVDRLSREGLVHLTPTGPGCYTLQPGGDRGRRTIRR